MFKCVLFISSLAKKKACISNNILSNRENTCKKCIFSCFFFAYFNLLLIFAKSIKGILIDFIDSRKGVIEIILQLFKFSQSLNIL